MRKNLLFGLICFFYSVTEGIAQEVFGEPQVWFLQLTTYDLTDNWRVGNELHARFDDYLNDTHQILIRPFFTYSTRPALAFSGGYTFITTFPYGAYPLPDNLPEHNVWEQVEVKQDIGRTSLLHRYRLEQRWIGDLKLSPENREFEVDGYNLNHRFRYRITAVVDLSEKWFLHFFDEFFIRSTDEIEQISFDRNWFYSGVGFYLNDRTNIQLAYLHQYIRRSPVLFEQHHSVQASLVISLKK